MRVVAKGEINSGMCSWAVFRSTKLCGELMQPGVAETCDQRGRVSASMHGSAEAVAWTNWLGKLAREEEATVKFRYDTLSSDRERSSVCLI